MSLTPSINDPNRKGELKRRKENPITFGIFRTHESPKDWTSTRLKEKRLKEVKPETK